MPIILNIPKEKIKEFIRENGSTMTAEQMAKKLIVGRTLILRTIKEMKATEPDFTRDTHQDVMRARLSYMRSNLHKPVNELAKELNITEPYARFLIRKRIMMTPLLEQNIPKAERHHNGFFNVNARWSWIVG